MIRNTHFPKKLTRSTSICLKLLCLFIHSTSLASTPAHLPTTNTHLKPLIIKSTDGRDVKLTESSASAIVIELDDESRLTHPLVTDLLNQQTGVEVYKSGGAGKYTSIFLRGSSPAHTLVVN